jgi:hypothetical protein
MLLACLARLLKGLRKYESESNFDVPLKMLQTKIMAYLLDYVVETTRLGITVVAALTTLKENILCC